VRPNWAAAAARIKNSFPQGAHSLLEQAAINNANDIAATICDAYVDGYVDGLYAGQAFPPTNSNMFYATAKAAFINYIQTYPDEGKLSAVVVMTRALLKNNIVYAKLNKGGK
jgi:TolA-binding protein